MNPIDNKQIFEQYYQKEYDFNTSSLSEDEIDDIKDLVKQKRVNYALAPIGRKIFGFIKEQCSNINFEVVKFDTEKIDGMLYIPRSGEEKAYIILNGNKPLINQIFAAAHEYYHYIRDYASIKRQPYICCLSSLKDIKEKRASRFAAELLLPSEALEMEIKHFRKKLHLINSKDMGFEEYACLSMFLTIKYELPLKAVIYRLHEEEYIKNIDQYIDKYEFIKNILMQVEIFKEQIEDLYAYKNPILESEAIIYKQIEKVYNCGLASRQEIIKDAENLNLNKEVINKFFDEIKLDDDDETEEDDIMDLIKNKWGGEA